MRTLLLFVLLLSAAASALAQEAPPGQPDPDYVIATEGRPRPPVPVTRFTRSYNAFEETIETDFTAVNLPPVELYSDVIRYRYDLPQPDSHRLHTVIQFALAGDGSRAQLLVIHADRYFIGEATLLRRERAWISVAEYDALKREVLRLAANLSESDLAHPGSFTVCSHSQSSRLDVRLEAAIVLRRDGSCNPDSAAYRAGEAMIRVAERALAHPIELRPSRPAPESRADTRTDR